MLRPLTRSSSGKFGRNTRHSLKKSQHSFKKLQQSLKSHVATNHRGTPQIRGRISRKSIKESNLTTLHTSRPKVAVSVSSSKGKRLSNDVPKTSPYPHRSKSENIFETPIPQIGKRSRLIKHFQDESSLNIRKGIIGIEQSISTVFKRVTRSSLGNIDDRNLLENRSHESRLAISLLSKSTEKHIKSKTTVKLKELNVTTDETKRITRSSTGKVASNNTFLKSKSSKDKLITSHQSTETHVKCKGAVKEKEVNIIAENPKRVTRNSTGSTIISSPKKTVKCSTPLVKKLPMCRILLSRVDTKVKDVKKTVSTQKDSEQVKCCTLTNASPSLQPAERERAKQQFKIKNASPASVSSKKPAQMKGIESASVTLIRNTRKSNSGSVSAKELLKRNCKNSTLSKGIKRKTTGSPQKDESKKNVTLKTPVTNEDDIPLDCLTMNIPNKRPRRHTVDVCHQNKKTPNPSTVQQKAKKTSTAKTKTKSSKPRKNNRNSSQSNSASSSALDMSQLSIDTLTTFRSETKSRKRRPKSAPAAMKRKSKVAGLHTPIPKKGTLKRQRWMFNALKDKNEGYEDDLFENQKFQTPVFRISNEADDESDCSIPTPKFGFLMTPALPKKTPAYKETISSSDLLLARKNAEEYIYRRNKKRTSDQSALNSPTKSPTSVECDEVPEKKKLEFAEAMEKVVSICKELEKKIEDESEDDYLADGFS